MKTIKLLLLVVLCVPAGAAAGPAPADFSYCAPVLAGIKADSLYQIHLSDEILRPAEPDLADLRLFGAAGIETPFTVIENMPPHEEMPESYSLKITGYETGKSSAVITMKLPEKHQPISILDLNIADKDFKKRVVLSVSRDGKSWQPHGEDSVYDFTSQVDLRKTRLTFSKTDARFFRIRLADDRTGQSGPQPAMRLLYGGLEFSVNGAQKNDLRIRSVIGSTLIPADKKPVYDRKTFTDLAPSLDKDGNTVIIFAPALPINQLSFDVNNRYYYRTVNIYGSTTGKDGSYRLLHSGQIYRFPLSTDQHEEKNQIESSLPKYAWCKLVVLNKSNPPLDIRGITVSWVQQNLYFFAAGSGEEYSLCFGNHHLKQPDYDIVRFVNRNTLSRHFVERASLGLPVKGSGPSPTMRERLAGMEKIVLKIVVVLIVIGMGGWLYTLLRKKPENK